MAQQLQSELARHRSQIAELFAIAAEQDEAAYRKFQVPSARTWLETVQ